MTAVSAAPSTVTIVARDKLQKLFIMSHKRRKASIFPSLLLFFFISPENTIAMKLTDGGKNLAQRFAIAARQEILINGYGCEGFALGESSKEDG